MQASNPKEQRARHLKTAVELDRLAERAQRTGKPIDGRTAAELHDQAMHAARQAGLNLYGFAIYCATGVTDPADLEEIEDWMRGNRRGLSDLSRSQITRSARECWADIQFMRACGGPEQALAALEAAA